MSNTRLKVKLCDEYFYVRNLAGIGICTVIKAPHAGHGHNSLNESPYIALSQIPKGSTIPAHVKKQHVLTISQVSLLLELPSPDHQSISIGNEEGLSFLLLTGALAVHTWFGLKIGVPQNPWFLLASL